MRLTFVALLCVLMAGPGLAQGEANYPDPVIQAARDQFVAGDHAAALAILRPLAEGGAPRAQNVLGAAYQYGNGVAVEAAQALDWFGRAAAQGYPAAIHNLGYLYEVGMPGQAPDLPRARQYYQQAASMDYGPSLGNLGGMMLQGIGGPQDQPGALSVLRRGVQLGDPNAAEWLAWANVTGTGLPVDVVEARRLYEISAVQGQPTAANEFGMMLQGGQGGPVDLPRAMMFYERAVAGGVNYAGINAAWLIFDHPDVFPDRVLGMAYCIWAVDGAHPDDRAAYAEACDGIAADLAYTEAELAQARKRAEGL